MGKLAWEDSQPSIFLTKSWGTRLYKSYNLNTTPQSLLAEIFSPLNRINFWRKIPYNTSRIALFHPSVKLLKNWLMILFSPGLIQTYSTIITYLICGNVADNFDRIISHQSAGNIVQCAFLLFGRVVLAVKHAIFANTNLFAKSKISSRIHLTSSTGQCSKTSVITTPSKLFCGNWLNGSYPGSKQWISSTFQYSFILRHCFPSVLCTGIAYWFPFPLP